MSGRVHAEGDLETGAVAARVDPLGRDLARAFSAVVESVPGGPHRPTTLARRLEMSRVIVSRLLNAIVREDPREVLEHVPGPESLRVVTRLARRAGASAAAVDEASEVVERFARVIREDFGTRSAFNAAIAAREGGTGPVKAGRYQVFMGMRQILGVEAETWLTSMLFAPSRKDPSQLETTTIHGALGMRVLRPDARVQFVFGPPVAPAVGAGEESPLSEGRVDLREFCRNEPAPLATRLMGGQLVHRLVHRRVGRNSTVDMLAVSHNARGARRYAAPGRPKGGLVVFPDVPVKMMVCDCLLHEEAFPGSTPELMVFNPGARGPANPVDPLREIDRVEVPEVAEVVGKRPDRFEVAEVPRYAGMLERVSREFGWSLSEFRVIRVRMVYPVHGFQFVIAMEAPPGPGPEASRPGSRS